MEGRAADIGAAVSVSVASVTWLTQLNLILQLVATIVAIVAGVAAARYHLAKTAALDDDADSG